MSAARLRSAPLDALRALAALAVVATHAGDAAGTQARRLAVLGFHFPIGRAIYELNIGVGIFFVISGYLVYRPFAAANIGAGTRPDLRRYAARRFLRIYPAYWVALTIIVLLFGARTMPSLRAAVAHATLTYSYVPGTVSSGIGLRQSWTLVMEMSFYVLVPLWAFATRGVGRRFAPLATEYAGALVLVVVGPLAMVVFHQIRFVYTGVLPFLGLFGAGMVIAVASLDPAVRPRLERASTRVWPWWIAAVAVYVAFVSVVQIPPGGIAITYRQQIAERIVNAIVGALLVAPLVFRPAREHQRVARAWLPLALIGLVSYGLYLWHYALLEWLHDHVFTGTGYGALLGLFVTTSVLAIALGAISWHVIERPALRLADAPPASVAPSTRTTEPRAATATAKLWPWVAGASVLGLAIRVVAGLRQRGTLIGDALWYHGVAGTLRSGYGFVEPLVLAVTGRPVQTATHPPLYPILLAAGNLVGIHTVTGHRVLSAVIGAAVVPLVAIAAHRLAGPRAAIVAAFVGAVSPLLWINDAGLLSESLLAPLTAAMIVAAIAVHDRPSGWRAIGLGVAVGAMALTRSETLLLAPILGLALAWRARRDPAGAARVAAGVVVAAGLVVLPWAVYNTTRFEQPVLLSGNFGGTLANSSCDAVWYGPRTGWWSLDCPPPPGGVAADEGVRDRQYRAQARAYWRAHSSRAPVVVAARVGRLWGVWSPRQTAQLDATERDAPALASWLVLSTGVLFVFGTIGVVVLHRRGAFVAWWWALLATATLTAVVFYGSWRFRVPADVGLVVLTGIGADALLAPRSRRAASEDADRRSSSPTTPVAASTGSTASTGMR